MPIVTIRQFAGRSGEQKQALAARIAEAVRDVYGATAQPVQVIFEDVRTDGWYSEGTPVADMPRTFGGPQSLADD